LALSFFWVTAALPLDVRPIDLLSPGQAWTADRDGARALFQERALVIGLKGTSFEATATGLRLVSGQALLVVGDRGATLETEAGSNELRGELVYLPRDAITLEQKKVLDGALRDATHRKAVLLPREVESPVPWTQTAQRQSPFEGLDVEALEIEADCVEICLE
jgi:hypothetical protein